MECQGSIPVGQVQVKYPTHCTIPVAPDHSSLNFEVLRCIVFVWPTQTWQNGWGIFRNSLSIQRNVGSGSNSISFMYTFQRHETCFICIYIFVGCYVYEFFSFKFMNPFHGALVKTARPGCVWGKEGQETLRRSLLGA